MKTSSKKTKNKVIKKSKGKKRGKIYFFKILSSFFWFLTGVVLATFFLSSFVYAFFRIAYRNVVYPGIIINNIDFGGKTSKQVIDYFEKKNNFADNTFFSLKYEDKAATVSAKEVNLGYDSKLLAIQAMSIGRSKNYFSDISIILQAYTNGVYLKPSFTYSEEKLKEKIDSIVKDIEKKPVDAQFKFENNRVTTFKPSEDGLLVDIPELIEQIFSKSKIVVSSNKQKTIIINIPTKIVKPSVTTDEVNDLGVKELIGTGTSLFQHSIQNRIYNVTLASTRLNGILIKPNEVFSFNNALGDVSSFTGYQQAYIIQNGRTVLGDGGGVCQVSTTLFRAALDAGLPIIERWAHAYRVGYYEQDSGPGLDATVYSPINDLKFKNDTGKHILMQAEIDPTILKLTFYLYGTKDGRISIVNKPVTLSQSPPPPPLYQDDPNLPKGTIKQVDFAAYGANVYFTRQVTKNGKIIISDKFVSNYKPWQEVYLRGTKE